MQLKGALRGATEWDLLFAVYVGFAVLVLLGTVCSFAQAWLAPRCTSIHDLNVAFTWCLPIGFEGPFADIWSNRSWPNARISATFHLIITVAAFACAVYFWMRGHERRRAIAYRCGLAVLAVGLVKSLWLNDLS
jgi:hypothetical protein